MWEYVKGSEADFEGAREWETLIITGGEFVSEWFLESFQEGNHRHRRTKGDTITFTELGLPKERYRIIAERRKVDDLQSRTNDANLQQAFDTVQRPAHYNQSGIDAYDKYNRPCKGVTIDVYDVLVAFNVTNPALQHLIKKALAVGQRGHKDKTEDLNDILSSAKRAIELEQ